MVEPGKIVGSGATAQPQGDAVPVHLSSVITQRFVELVLARGRTCQVELPAQPVLCLEKSDRVPKPAAPPPTIATFFGVSLGVSRNSVSRPARGLTRQLAGRSEKMKSRHA